MSKKIKLRSKIIVAIMIALSINNQSAFADFTGDFAPDNWTYSETGDGFSGFITTISMALISSDLGMMDAGTKGLYSIVIPHGVTSISFSFEYINGDAEYSIEDLSQVVLGGVVTEISGNFVESGATKTGTITLDTIGGQLLSIEQLTTDALLGASITFVGDFQVKTRNAFNSDLLVASSGPELTAGTKTLTCSPGSYNLLLNGFSSQGGKPASIAYTLIIGGKRVSTLSSDGWTGMLRALFDTSDNSVTGSATIASATWNVDSYKAGSAQCEVVAYQSGSVTTSLSNTK